MTAGDWLRHDLMRSIDEDERLLETVAGKLSVAAVTFVEDVDAADQLASREELANDRDALDSIVIPYAYVEMMCWVRIVQRLL